MPAIKFNFNLTPKKALDYLNNKGFLLSFNYEELKHHAHHQSFTVAKVTRVDLLNDIFTSLNDAYKNGTRFTEWKKQLIPTLAKKGWLGKVEVTDPKTGEVKIINVNSRRLSTIFRTNMRVAYNVQRYSSMSKLPTSVYWRYSSMMLANGRDAHKAINGTLLHRDDPFWQTNYPPNGWNCRCKVRAYSKKQAEKKGMTISKTAPKSVADQDWSYNVGAGSKVAKLAALNLGNSLSNGLQVLKPNPTLDKLDDNQLKERFYTTLGIKKGDMFIDKVGDPMVIDDDLFTKVKSGKGKIRKLDRHLYLDELAKTISDPDEIYIEVESRSGKQQLIKKMFRYFEDEKGDKKATMALFTFEQDKTIGTTIYVVDKAEVLDKKRVQKLIYKK